LLIYLLEIIGLTLLWLGGPRILKMSIAEMVNKCFIAFKELCELLNNSHDDEFRAAHEAYRDELGRFRIWAGNIAAHRTGLSSLDHRLRDASRLKATVENYLDELLRVLDRCEF